MRIECKIEIKWCNHIFVGHQVTSVTSHSEYDYLEKKYYMVTTNYPLTH